MPVHTDDALARPPTRSTGNHPRRLPSAACPRSNGQTAAVPDLAKHPVRCYFDYRLRVTVHPDDRLLIDTRDLKDLPTMIVSGFKSAFRPDREKADLLAAVNRELQPPRGRFPRPGPRVAA